MPHPEVMDRYGDHLDIDRSLQESVVMGWQASERLVQLGGETTPEARTIHRVRNTLGNGYLTYTPGEPSSPSRIYINGLFEDMHVWKRGDREVTVPSTISLPDFWRLGVAINGSDMSAVNPADLTTSLDLRHQTLTSIGSFTEAAGQTSHVRITQFLDRADPSLACMEIEVTPDYDGELTLRTGIDGTPARDTDDYYSDRQTEILPGDSVLYTATTRGGKRVAISQTTTPADPFATQAIHDRSAAEGMVWQDMTLRVKAGETYRLTSITRIHSDVDQAIIEGSHASPEAIARANAATPQLYADRLTAHREAWHAAWREADIAIVGDDAMQQALRFNLAHLRSSVRPGYRWHGIGAKIGMEQNQGYGGRHFWDAEMFNYPALGLSEVRSLLDYRLVQLPAAMRKAAQAGLNGAWFMWESQFADPEGKNGEGCPQSVINNVGEVMEIDTPRQAIHISADVAYAATRYHELSGDTEGLLRNDAPLVIESARFLASRATLRDGVYIYEDVLGPDEYHPGVTNNAYTLLMAKKTLRTALQIIDGQLARGIPVTLDNHDIAHLQTVHDNLYIPFDTELLVFSAFDGWEALKEIDPAYFAITNQMDALLRAEHASPDNPNPIERTKVIKQHDTLQMLVLLREEILDLLPPESRDTLLARFEGDRDRLMKAIYRANYDTYMRHTCDGSSLSPSTGILIGLLAGEDPDACYRQFEQKVAYMDLGSNTHKTQDGLHTANAGASKIVVSEGFMGIRMHGNTLTVEPHLPSAWTSAAEQLTADGQAIRVVIEHDSVTVIRDQQSSRDLPLRVNGANYLLAKDTESLTVETAPTMQPMLMTA